MAATLYFLLTQRVPPAAINRSFRDELVAPRLLNPLLSANTERVLLKALAVDADQRYRTMEEFAQALQNRGFTAYADPTISDSGIDAAYAHRQGVVSQVQSRPSSMDGRSVPRPALVPAPARQSPQPPPPVYPMLPASPVAVPQPRVTQSYQPLPSPFSQGCLWGLLQGVLGALIVLLLKKEVYFYLAILEGFLFYLLAGFLTTRKGGSSSRGAWAGFWSGITSTIVFWVAAAIGFAVLITQRIEADTAAAQRLGFNLNPSRELNHALQVVGSAFPIHPPALIFLVGGLLCAIGFGWLGGVLGKSRYRKKMQGRGYP